MTDVLFITSSHVAAMKHEVNGTMLLATKLLEAGFSVEILRFCQVDSFGRDYPAFIGDITRKILSKEPRCVSFYTLWPYYHIMLAIARELKKEKPEIRVVFGGPQASATAKATMNAMKAVDYICTGEGENTVVPFFRAVLGGDEAALTAVPGLYYRSGGEVVFNDAPVPLSDLDTLPRWNEQLLLDLPEPRRTSSKYFMPIDAGRGCPFSCTFCSSSRFWHRTYRMKSPERIMSDILYYRERFGISSFAFSHDAFTTNQKLVTKICDRIIEEKLDIKWKCTARINCVSEELILKMMAAGMTHIEFGIETGSVRMQKLTNKKLDLARVKRIVEFLLKNKIHVALFFMYGFPEEQEEDLNDTLELALSLADMGVPIISMSFCNFNPNTQITRQYFEELVLDPDIKVPSRGVFGYGEELQVIKDNKDIFPFFYHLNTPVRNAYQYLNLFNQWYKQFPKTAQYLRKVYRGDNLRFYRDFYTNNSGCFERSIDEAVSHVLKNGYEILVNTVKDLDTSYMEQLKELMRFEYDLGRVRQSAQDMTVSEEYGFSYLDYQRGRPIEQYSRSTSRLLLQKENGKMKMRLLGIQ